MADRGIIFSAPMVLALLAGRKTMTRRIIPHDGSGWYRSPDGEIIGCMGNPPPRVRLAAGDRLWVREGFAVVPPTAYRASSGVESNWNPNSDYEAAVYRAGWERSPPGLWRSPIHMSRWASRLTLHVEEVRVERLQEISGNDAIAEGAWPVEKRDLGRASEAVDAFRDLWTSLHGPGSWEANPWVAAIRFHPERANIDATEPSGC